VRARDRHCQAPGCCQPAHRCEIDHRIPWHRGGPTLIDNLYCLCKRHHRAKDVAGYFYHPGPDGIRWITPYGHHYLREHTDRYSADPGRRRRRGHNRMGIAIAVDTDQFHLRPPPTLRH
jgi:hypothetical protein